MSKDPELQNYKLIDLLEEINSINGIQRIRLGSIEPLLITEEFVERLKKLEKICHHFHLSLQSGCDETLKRMNRRYTTEQFKEIVRLLRNAYDDVNLTTDVIVGFPGETDEEFSKTYKFLEEIKFYKMHIFKYSPRKGTKAAVMPNQISGDIKEERSRKLIELSDKNEIEYNESYIGKNVEVLFEEEKDGIFKGHTQNYIMVYCELNKNLENQVISVRCEKAEQAAVYRQYFPLCTGWIGGICPDGTDALRGGVSAHPGPGGGGAAGADYLHAERCHYFGTGGLCSGGRSDGPGAGDHLCPLGRNHGPLS